MWWPWKLHRLLLVLILGCRQHKLDSLSHIQYEVSPLISYIIIKSPINSFARSGHTAWTPPSHPDSIVLLGGSSSATYLTAEIWPGFLKQNTNF